MVEINRRKFLQGATAIGSSSVMLIGSSNADSIPRGPDEALRQLVEEHGRYKIDTGVILSDNGEKIADTAGDRLIEDHDCNVGSVSLVQPLKFEDGYTTRTETWLELDKAQEAAIEDQSSSPAGTLTLVSSVEGEKFKEEFDMETMNRMADEARRNIRNHDISRDTNTRNVSPDSIGPGETSIFNSTDGNTQVDHGIPVLNAVGANYKTSDNRCGAAQRSSYLSINASASAEVFSTEYVLGGMTDVRISFNGDIQGTISNIGMGGAVTAEGFIRNTETGNEESTLLMDAHVGVVELPFVTGGNVDGNFGLGSGAVGDQPYLDFEFHTDLEYGYYDIGVRLNVAFNGLRGGMTVTNFMPAEEDYQPKNLGIEYFNIDIDA